ncbi:MAG: hypothetical protein HQM00_17075 [Magnetococcales bacterium]|nr:hypothetical protein [Magnetococcales bacterium]
MATMNIFDWAAIVRSFEGPREKDFVAYQFGGGKIKKKQSFSRIYDFAEEKVEGTMVVDKGMHILVDCTGALIVEKM